MIASAQSDFTRNTFGEVSGSHLTFTVTQALLRGFGRKATQFDLTNAKRNLQSSGRNLEITRQRLAVEVVASYYNIVRQQGLVEVAEKSAERSRELLRASEARLKVGLASKLDVFRAELQLSQAEVSLIRREEALELAMDTFKFNLGLNPQDEVYLEMVAPDYQPVVLDLRIADPARTQSPPGDPRGTRSYRRRAAEPFRLSPKSIAAARPELSLPTVGPRRDFPGQLES